MEYRICFTRLVGGRSSPITKEFESADDQEALKVYQDFCRKAKDARDKFAGSDIPEGLFRIDRREIITCLDKG